MFYGIFKMDSKTFRQYKYTGNIYFIFANQQTHSSVGNGRGGGGALFLA